ncbi:hypothetical protein LG314_06665 [Agrococcus terreus]|uniref:YtxH domain-containing protein n=1 Tax=Agrococcus terreus TaxID=574649 RepID=A0ABQ2KHS2_9MICO|nr:hypothetical protein [Agrococcus terreus]GGN83517.1 hypothetical protein GCM10010968_14380 [Agrococcus terreus]
MKKLLFLAVGVAVGVLAARKLEETEKGKRFFDGVDSRTREFTDAVKDGYRSRDRELRGE